MDLNNLPAFIAVMRERSFTRAAAQLGVSQSTSAIPSARWRKAWACAC
jgi:DNA-binding transcriptional LysR family regulator